MRRAWALLAHDPDTGAATLPVAVLVVDGSGSVVSWVPLEDIAAGDWRSRVADTDPAAADGRWVEEANGITWDLVELLPPGTPDLRRDAEALMDDLLAEGAADGSGGSKTHESFTVTSGGSEALPAADALEGDPETPSPLLDQVLQQLASFPEVPGPDGDWTAGYAALVEQHTKARDLVGESLLAGASVEELEAARSPIKAATKARLDQVPPEELSGLAAASGFEHPGLVGLGDGPSPLVHWLDPAY